MQPFKLTNLSINLQIYNFIELITFTINNL